MLSDVAVLAVECRRFGKKRRENENVAASLCPNSGLRKLQWTAKLESDPQQTRRLPQSPPPLRHCQDCCWGRRGTFMTSSDGNRGAAFLDAVNTPVGDALQGWLLGPRKTRTGDGEVWNVFALLQRAEEEQKREQRRRRAEPFDGRRDGQCGGRRGWISG